MNGEGAEPEVREVRSIKPEMRTYIARRVLHGLLVLWLVSLVIFSLVRILPGDAVIMQLDQAAAASPRR